ncbi:NAD(P)-dependent oxidoreductase [Amaricoccus sp.]|uniref:NAD(P)-dependent oxidoreductase n=1 Tax=Amaricoccus sp. TaxID=1872485 RepID=UPI0026100E91|nr:NAD(P)-dependent oxidoreductase [Amaricoccus sp.]HRO12453.1 NAD(P)-dependent oxidoreductase [Amaricoccus sp.]
MAEGPVVGFVGVGLMGWGMAKNAVEKGWPLRVIAHRKREAVDDLVKRGAREVASLAEMAGEADVVVLCVTGSPEVEATVAGLLPAARPGLTILDASTSDPEVTERLAAELAGKGITLLDAPLSRTPVQAWAGELTTFVGGPAELVEKWRPLLATWASAIIPTGGPVGSAHALKLINNLVALGYAAVWAECFAMAKKVGAAPGVLREVISNSGMNCANFQNFAKYAVEGDPEAHRFSIANAFKDLSYYERLATRHRAATLMSDGALQTLKLGMAMGMGERYVPEMTDIMLALNGDARGGEPGPDR